MSWQRSNRLPRAAVGQGFTIPTGPTDATGRRAFFSVDPQVLENVDAQAFQDVLPSSTYTRFDPFDYLEYLSEKDAEIFWMIAGLGKSQKDVGDLVCLNQSTVSYRFGRAVEKLAYLVVLAAVDVDGIVETFDFLRPDERAVLVDLFFFVNQAAVGARHGKNQSSVKWIALKTRAALERLEPEDPERWGNALGLVYYLFRNLGIRIRSE